jgi:hypothetical protein
MSDLRRGRASPRAQPSLEARRFSRMHERLRRASPTPAGREVEEEEGEQQPPVSRSAHLRRTFFGPHDSMLSSWPKRDVAAGKGWRRLSARSRDESLTSRVRRRRCDRPHRKTKGRWFETGRRQWECKRCSQSTNQSMAQRAERRIGVLHRGADAGA